MSCVYVLVFTIRLYILRCVYFALVSFVLVYRYGILFGPYGVLSYLLSVLSCLVDVRNTKQCLGTQSCSIRVRPSTQHVSHGNRGPWKHLLARSGFVELVPVVVHFPKLMWLLAFAVPFAPLRKKKVSSRFVFNDVCWLPVTVVAL